MKILLDECLPRKLKRMFAEHQTFTVRERNWTGTKNGALLRLAEGSFDVFITADQNLSYQQNLQSSVLRIIVLAAPYNSFEALQVLVPQVKTLLPSIMPGEVIRVRMTKG